MKVIALRVLSTILLTAIQSPALAQIDEHQLGVWRAYNWRTGSSDSRWGLEGDFQLRTWNINKDLEQYSARAGVTFSPNSSNNSYTVGLARMTSGQFGDGTDTSTENRTFQDATFRQRVGERVYLRHRLRTEQRWIEHQDFRTRHRYLLHMDMALNQTNLEPGAWILSLNSELLLNGERDIGGNRRVGFFDQFRSYVGVGHIFKSNLRLQFGYMHQWSDNLHKGQLQLGLSQRF